MATTFDTHNGIESTIELLQAELPQLQVRQQVLEKDLASVTERLEAVRTALDSLRALTSAPAQAEQVDTGRAAEEPPAGQPQQEPAAAERPAQAEPQSGGAEAGAGTGEDGRREETTVPAPRTAERAPRKSVAGRGKTAGAPKAKRSAGSAPKKAAAASKAARKPAAKRVPGLTEGVVECLNASEGPLRAGEINQKLGRGNTPGSVNAVRNTLERLAAASRVQRVGRGLYRAATG